MFRKDVIRPHHCLMFLKNGANEPLLVMLFSLRCAKIFVVQRSLRVVVAVKLDAAIVANAGLDCIEKFLCVA